MFRLRERYAAFGRLKNKVGLFRALGYVGRFFVNRTFNRRQFTDKRDVVDFYGFITQPTFSSKSSNISSTGRIRINWVIPDFCVGSGGHMTIFRTIQYLENAGFECSIIIIPPCAFVSENDARDCINENFFPINARVFTNYEDMPAADVTFATSWPTAYYVRKFLDAGKRMYFVQDFEPYFYAHGGEYAFAEETYRFGFSAVTAGDWLAKKLTDEYGMQTCGFSFSYDKDIYKPKEKRNNDFRNIFFYARPVTERRGFELGMLALSELCKKRNDVAALLVGWDVSDCHIDFPHLACGTVTPEELADLYAQSELALVLSFTNLSLLPIELMASGCPVVSNHGDNVEWMLNDSNTMLADANVESLVAATEELLDDETKRLKIRDEGMRFVQQTDWSIEGKKIENFILKQLDANQAE